ncbi:MAG TPA: hypothetical protein VJM46_01920, partial [Candidatus Saccharimonadales bacterium]|nr:hypothetical protein [Candidatus Saccharimonadales bacterium]
MQKPKRFRKIKFFAALALIGGILFVTHQPDKAAEAHDAPPKPAYTADVRWPAEAKAAAIGVQGSGVISSHNDSKPRPIA